ncbi:MAG: type IV pili methyl-accepting chemotaxis transducer N-terminal domain-containing protein [Planctomycetes bacterium]|nr:type IV pili methyl-accepting chemotaxis transducer N-terminal domain-containing protein [Planctomycetota bacterium]
MRRAWLVWAAVSVVVSVGTPPAGADDLSGGQALAVNVAGRQRMLTQKAAKEMLLLALSVDVEGTRTKLRETRDLFERSHERLRDGDAGLGGLPRAGPPLVMELTRVGILWKDEYRPLIDASLAGSKVDPAVVRRKSAELLTQVEAMVLIFEAVARKEAPSVAARSVNLAGRQRMLSQKMSKEFLLIALKDDVEAQRKLLRESRATFARALQGLRAGDAELGLGACVDARVLTALAEEERVWKLLDTWFAKAEFMTAFPPADLASLAELSEKLLAAADVATTAFQGWRPAQ